jgi:hypothetical protein
MKIRPPIKVPLLLKGSPIRLVETPHCHTVRLLDPGVEYLLFEKLGATVFFQDFHIHHGAWVGYFIHLHSSNSNNVEIPQITADPRRPISRSI